MQGALSTYTPSDCRHDGRFVPQDNGIGDLFRDYGEAYIEAYSPGEMGIKLIRSIRLCKTPAMGGKRYECKGCGTNKYVYFGCGNSRCPKCQGIKRQQWQDKISALLFSCPYVHMIFTIPRELHTLCRRNPSQAYNNLMRSAWESLKACCLKKENVGGVPGVIMVLHTFGSDLKYHVHAHALVSFGGMDRQGVWHWPKRKRKLIPYREIRTKFRSIFLKNLKKEYKNLTTRESYEDLEAAVTKKEWCVHAEPPVSDPKHVREYLGRYICRIGLSKKKFLYDKKNREVHLQFKDYRNQNHKTKEIPIGTKTMQPLAAIHQIMQHCLPKYYQKCRYYGLHSSASKKKYEDQIPTSIKNNGGTIRTVMQIITVLVGQESLQCDHCQKEDFNVYGITPDKRWYTRWPRHRTLNRGSPIIAKHIKRTGIARQHTGSSMP